MARKVFQDFANVLCQRFVEVPSNKDLVNLALLGGGTLVLDIMSGKAICNRFPVEPLPYCGDARTWLDTQMVRRRIPHDDLAGALLTVEYQVHLSRKPNLPVFPVANFDFICTAIISAPDRQYTSVRKAQKTWGLSLVS